MVRPPYATRFTGPKRSRISTTRKRPTRSTSTHVQFFIFFAGGAYENSRSRRTAGPTDIRLLKIDDIVQAMQAQKEKSVGTPDHSAIAPDDPPPLPWKKIK